jgi:hypothetical protein
MRNPRTIALSLAALAVLAFSSLHSHAQAALLMEEPYGFFGALNPTGHNAIYFERVCAETPTSLRRCHAGELGSVLSRYQGIAGYDWIAIPLIPYLYSVEDASQVPSHVNRATVHRLRDRYRETHLLGLGGDLASGGFLRGGWTELVGVSYERRIYAFRFETTEEQDDALIARLNAGRNRSQFNLLFNNCSDFARRILDAYYPGVFRRSIFPDAGMTTPKQITYKLVHHARKHPEMQLTILEIAQIPGYRRKSSSNKSIAESLSTTGYAVPIVLVNPYLAGGLLVDYLARGRFRPVPTNPQVMTPDNLMELTVSARTAQNPGSAGEQVPGAAASDSVETPEPTPANSGLTEIKASHE